jgi:capsular exopolysaccharide synthesis family protein
MYDQPQPQSEMSIRDYADLLVRRRFTILKTFALVFLIGAALTWTTKPVYRANTRILVQGEQSGKSDFEVAAPIKELLKGEQGRGIDTQLEIIGSPKVVNEAYRLSRVPQGSVRVIVNSVEDTDVIAIAVESEQPEYAKRMAEVLPESYRKHVVAARKQGVKNALSFVNKRLPEESQKLLAAQLALRDLKQGRGVFDLQSQIRNDLEAKKKRDEGIAAEQTRLAGARAQLKHLEGLRAAAPEYIETPTQQSNNVQLDAIRGRIEDLRTERAKQSTLYKPTDVRIQTLDRQIEAEEERLSRTPARITVTVKTPNPTITELERKIGEAKGVIESSGAELANLRAEAAANSGGLNKYNAVEVKLEELQNNKDRHAATVAKLTSTLEELSIQEKTIDDKPVETITPAGNAKLVGPLRVKNLIFAALIGLILGVCMALLQEYLDDRVQAPEDAMRLLEAPGLGYVPMVEADRSRLLSADGAGGSLMETYRLLRSNVQFAAVDSPTHTLLITSSMPGEGKSLTACNLAVATAMNGRRVIIVDADLRRPTVHEKFGLERQPGLTNVLIGHSTLDEALQDTDVPELKVLSCGHIPPNPAELLSSRAMRDLIEELKARADLVIFDSSPVLATADAQVLANDVDGVLYVVQLGETRKSAVRVGSDLLRQARANVMGVVFNMIKMETKGRYGYGSGYHYGYYGAYRYYSQYASQLPDDRPERSRLAAEFEALPRRGADENGASANGSVNGAAKSNGNGSGVGVAADDRPSRTDRAGRGEDA